MPMSRRPSLRTSFLPALVLALAVSSTAPWAAGVAAAATRTIYLIRHGDYDHNDSRDEKVGKGLIPLGREQAEITAKRFAKMGVRFEALYVSELTRARETADIMAARMPYLKPVVDPDLSECTPATRRTDIMEKLEEGEAEACSAQLDRALERYFRPTEGDEDVYDLVVCHGNVIRYLWCRALDVDTEAWLNMTMANCGVTIIDVRADGTLRPVTFDDFHHLPPSKQTFLSSRKPAGLK